MVIKRKGSKEMYVQSDMEEMVAKIIDRGGKTAADAPVPREPEQPVEPDEVRFTLRIRADLIEKIDGARKRRVGNVSRNQWIVEAISEAIK